METLTSRLRPPPRGWGRVGLRAQLAAVVSLALIGSNALATVPVAAAQSQDPLPRSYQISEVAEVPDPEFAIPLLSIAADGSTAVHIRPGEQHGGLVATDLTTGAQQAVGIGPDGNPVLRVQAAAVSGNGRVVAFVASGANSAELGLPAAADPDLHTALFRYDRVTGATTWIPVPDLGVPASHHLLSDVALSEDGRTVATRITLPQRVELTRPSGVLLATVASDGAVSSRVIGPESLVAAGTDVAVDDPDVHRFAVSGDGAVLAVAVRHTDSSSLLRFATADGARLPGERAITLGQLLGWSPALDRAGVRTALAGDSPAVTVVDLAAGPTADLVLPAATTAPFASGDVPIGAGEPAEQAVLTADGGSVAFVRVGALWTQSAAGGEPVLVSSGTDGRIGDPVPGEVVFYPDRVASHAAGRDGSVLAFVSSSGAFNGPREPGAPRLWRATPSATPAPSWPTGAALELTPGTANVVVRWPAALGSVASYEVSGQGRSVSVAAPATQANLAGLTAGSTVDVSVVAKDSAGRASAALTARVTLADELPPGDAPLSAVAGPGAVVRLEWPAAAVHGLTGYQVLRNGTALAYVDAATTSYVDRTVAADSDYTYKILGLLGEETVPLTRDAAVHTDPLHISEAAATLPRLADGTIALGRPATFAVIGAPGFTATAQVRIRTSTGTDTVEVALPEQPAGTYRATWSVPEGGVEILAATLRLADGSGQGIDHAAGQLPAAVSGLIRTTMTMPGGTSAGVRYQVWSDKTGYGHVTTVRGDSVIDAPVPPADDYRLTTLRADGHDGTPPVTTAVLAGEIKSMTLTPYTPARLALTLRSPGGVITDQQITVTTRGGPRSATTDAQGQVVLDGLDGGDTVAINVVLADQLRADRGLAAIGQRSLTLQSGDNALVVEADALPRVTVHGTVTRGSGQPVVADVTVQQRIGHHGVSHLARSNADGTWSVQVYGGADSTTASAQWATAGMTSPVPVDLDSGNPVNLVFASVTGYVIHPVLTTVEADGSRHEQPLDPNASWRYGLIVEAGTKRFQPRHPSQPIDLATGETVTFCADGIESGYSRACVSAQAGDDSDIVLPVEIKAAGSVRARFLGPDGNLWNDSLCLTAQGTSGSSMRQYGSGQVDFSVPEAGRYLVTATVCKTTTANLSIQRMVTIEAGQMVDLGELRLSSQRTVIDGARSGLLAVTSQAEPGGLIRLRADIVFTTGNSSGQARLSLPPGTEVAQNGVLRGGEVVPFDREGDTLLIGLPSAPARTLDVYLRAPGQSGLELPFGMSVAANGTTELLGTVTVAVGMVTIEAPNHSRTGSFTATGWAPAGHVVTVHNRLGEVASAVASAGGLWRARVDLPGAGDDMVRHTLWASTAQQVSDPIDVMVDPHASTLEQVIMSQPDHSQTIRPADGLAVFSWIWVPRHDITIEARFSGPVEAPLARLGDLELPMTAVAGQADVYRVVVRPQAQEVGDLSIDYEPVRDRPTLPVPSMPTEGLLFDPQTAILGEPVRDGEKVSQTMTAPVPAMGPTAQAIFTIGVEPMPGYKPDAEAAAKARAAGVPVYSATIDATNVSGGTNGSRYQISGAGVVDLDKLAEVAPAGVGKNLSGFITGPARFFFEFLFINVTTDDSLYSALTGGEKWTALNDLMRQANACADPQLSNIYHQTAERLMHRATALDVYSAASTVAGAAVSGATLGVGVTVWGVLWGIGKLQEFTLNSDIDALQRAMNSDPDCRYPRDSWPHRRSDGPRRDDVASPLWRYDPSGFVYEGQAHRSVEGVTATVLYGLSEHGPWQPWDAAAFGDANPQLTDTQGRYGWDVPEGWWKVIYQKEGYLPAESRVMRVLPPHTDVNVNLVRSQPAAVEHITADQTGLTVTFTQPMRAAQTLARLTLTAADGGEVAGTWEPSDASAAPQHHPHDGESLATTFRFHGNRYRGEVTVAVGELAQDHVGRAVAEATQQKLTVDWHAADQTPPTVAVTGVAQGAVYQLGAVPTAGCQTSDEGSGVATPATLTLQGGTGVGLMVATCAGAVDAAGNDAAPVSVTYSVLYHFTGYGPLAAGHTGTTLAIAGLPVPLAWQITDAGGRAVTNVRSVTLVATRVDCSTGRAASGASGIISTVPATHLLRGNYLAAWTPPRSLKNTCQRLRLDLGEGSAANHTAVFRLW